MKTLVTTRVLFVRASSQDFFNTCRTAANVQVWLLDRATQSENGRGKLKTTMRIQDRGIDSPSTVEQINPWQKKFYVCLIRTINDEKYIDKKKKNENENENYKYILIKSSILHL